MVDVSGIPNLGFGGGPILGGVPNIAPAMSADQINASIWGRYSPQQAQGTLNQIMGPLTQDPARYAGISAAYGRQTGGFGLLPSGAQAPAGRVGTISNPSSGGAVPMPQPRPATAPAATLPSSSAAWSRTLYNPAPMGPAQSFSPTYSSLPTRSFTPPPAPQAPAPDFNDVWSNRGAPALSPSAISAQQLQMWNRGLPAQGGLGVPGSGNASSPLTRVHITAPPTAPPRSTLPSFDSAAQALMAQRNFTQPADFNSRFNAMLPKVNPGPSNYFESITQDARQQPFINAFNRGAFAPAQPAGSYDIGGRAKTPAPLTNPLNRVDWGQSYGAGNPAMATALRNLGAQRTAATLADRMGSFPTPVGPAVDMLRNAAPSRSIAPTTPADRMGSFAPVANRDAMAQALLNRGNALDMPSGVFGGHPPATFGATAVPGGSGYIGRDGVHASPFGAFVPQQRGFAPSYLQPAADQMQDTLSRQDLSIPFRR